MTASEQALRATVFSTPEQVGRLVTIHAGWAADNGYETAAFATKDEAIEFCWKRWRVPPEAIRIKEE